MRLWEVSTQGGLYGTGLTSGRPCLLSYMPCHHHMLQQVYLQGGAPQVYSISQMLELVRHRTNTR